MKQAPKTNAMRLLEKLNITYTPHQYDTSDGALDGVSVAHKVGQNPDKVFKTLVARGASKALHVFCIPVAQELDLKAAARATGEKNMEMIHVKEITPLTGYVKGGCSPLGMKKQYNTVIDESARQQDTIVVSGGRIGLQIEVNPQELAKAAKASFAQVSHE